MTKRVIPISAITICILNTSIFSLTLEEASKEVFNNHPEIKERLEHLRDVKYDYAISKSSFLPKIDASASMGSEKYISDPSGGARNTASMNTKTVGVILNQNIFNGFGNYHNVEAEKNRLTSAEFFLKEKSDAVILELTDKFLALLKKYAQLEISKDNVSAHKKTYEKIKERKEAGYSTISELWQAESRYNLAQSELIAAELSFQDTMATFAKIYGKQVLAINMVRPEFGLKLPYAIEEATALMMENNPSVKVEELNTKIVKQQYIGSHAAFFPKIDFDMAVSRSENGSGARGSTESYSGGFKLYYNLFNGLSDMERTKKYLANMNSQAATAQNTKIKAIEKLKLSWNSYMLLSKQIEFLKQYVELSKNTLEAYNEEFLLGRRTIIDLLGAESEYNNAKKGLVSVDYDLLLAKFRVYDGIYGLTDTLVSKKDALDDDIKSAIYKKLSPDALDSDASLQKALEKNKKDEPAKEAVHAPSEPLPSSAPQVPLIETEQVAVESLPKQNHQDSIKTTQKEQSCYRVAANKLFVRAEPKLDAKITGYMPKGFVACSETVENGWIKLHNGWASINFMRHVEGEKRR